MTPPPTLSLIIPMYNARATIEPCLKSLLAGTTAQVEILLIDDGSTDGSADLIRQAFASALADGSLTLIQQTNQGVSVARNTGLDRARGRYIGFVDADDVVHTDYFSHLLNAIAAHPSDIIEFGFQLWDGQFPVTAQRTLHAVPRFGHFRRRDVERTVFGNAMWYPWSRLFRRELFTHIRFPPGVRFCEDLMTITRVYPLAKTVSSLAAALYHYRVNPNGATLVARPEYVAQLTQFYRSILHEQGDCTDLLKMAIQFSIYSCQQNMGLPYELDPQIQRDFQRIRRKVGLCRYLHHRRWRILWFPILNRRLAQLKRRPQGR